MVIAEKNKYTAAKKKNIITRAYFNFGRIFRIDYFLFFALKPEFFRILGNTGLRGPIRWWGNSVLKAVIKY